MRSPTVHYSLRDLRYGQLIDLIKHPGSSSVNSLSLRRREGCKLEGGLYVYACSSGPWLGREETEMVTDFFYDAKKTFESLSGIFKLQPCL
jgi:hypothetical protein